MTETPKLARRIGLPLLLFFGLGNILGAGIYVLVGKVAGAAGMYAPLSFIVALAVASLTAMSYSELASRYPVSAGEAVYVAEGLPYAFLPSAVGIAIAFSGLISAAVMALGFVGYLGALTEVNGTAALAAVLAALGAVAVWGIGESVAVAAALTLIEVGGLLLMVWIGLPALAELPQRLPELVPKAEWATWSAIVSGAFMAFYAFIGFEDMVNIGEEVKAPERNLPRAIFLALGAAALLYVAVSLVGILMLPPETLSRSEAPFALLYSRATGEDATVIALISLFAVINGALVQIIMASRIFYGMSVNGWLPTLLGRVHPRTRTPVAATLLAVGIVAVFALLLPLETLAQTTSTLILVIFSLVNLALVRIKRRRPAPEGVKTVPIWIPVAGLTLNILFLAAKFFS